MKENDKMPKRGINNLIMTSGPWEPEWYESYNRQYMPNGTEFKFFNYSEIDQQVEMISKEMEKLGVEGA